MLLTHVLTLALALAACTGKGRDVGPDSGVAVAEPGPLMAGIATTRNPAPLGIGTAGYGPFGAPDSPSPFAEIYPATTRIHGMPEIKVVVLSRGEGFQVIFVRVDAVGFFQQLRRAVVLELQARTGQDLDQALVFGATHTHSGPGRVVDGGGLFDIIADKFFPEYYDRFVSALADTIQAALDDLQPARIGTTVGRCDDAHIDRRCEDGVDYQNGDMPVIAVERDGQVDAVVMSYAIHGTILGIDDLTLSQDVSGAIEEAVEDRFDHPVEALMLNAWAADMAPGSPKVPSQDGVADRPAGYDQMEQVGVTVADSVDQAMLDLDWTDTPTLALKTVRVPINRDVIGYPTGTFEYDYGAVYCDGDSDCDPTTTVDGLDSSCLPFTQEYPAPNQTVMSAGTVGGLTLITFPGEPGTLLAEQVMADVRAAWPDVGDIMFVGYSQDYLGYSILEDDWWQGGYEASGALWGPRQGEYLAGRAVATVAAYLGGFDLPDQPDPITPFDPAGYDPYVAEDAVKAGTLAVDVAKSYALTDTVTFTVWGSDPWLGPPVAWLETADGLAVSRPNGAAVNSLDYEFHTDLVPDPSYGDDIGPTARNFGWTFSMPVQRSTVGWTALAAGDYRMRVEVPVSATDTVDVYSGTFSVVGP
ncbi:MAG: hypothetical protein GXP62_08810 [Oligoflexia bacterium]|nr:hypothetical protein [Oligoflexia bacterium]